MAREKSGQKKTTDGETRKQNFETSAAAVAGKTSNAAAMPFGDLPDESEAEACATGGSATLIERLEDLAPVAL